MAPITLSSIKDCYSIYSNGSYFVLNAKHLWIFRTDGQFIAKHKEFISIHNVAFLPDNKVFLYSAGAKEFVYLSLENGEILWRTKAKGRRWLQSEKFAISPDQETIYNHFNIRNDLYIDVFCPKEQRHTIHRVPSDFRTVSYINCDEDGELYALQNGLNPTDGVLKEYLAMQTDKIFVRGVSRIKPDAETATIDYPYVWTMPSSAMEMAFGKDHVLDRDLTVRNYKTGETFDILENDGWLRPSPKDIFSYTYLPDRNYLLLHYSKSKATIIIDCARRKRVAQYARRDFSSIGYIGALVDDKYWFGTPDGVIACPFPQMEELPYVKSCPGYYKMLDNIEQN